MGTPAPISVNDDLTPSQTSVALKKKHQTDAAQHKHLFKNSCSLAHLRSSDDKAATGLQMVNGFIIEVPTGYHRLHHLLLQATLHLVQTDRLIVLHRYHYGVDAQRHHGATILPVLDSDLRERLNDELALTQDSVEFVFPPHLCFGVRAEPRKRLISAQLCQLHVELVSQDDGEGHALLSLVGGVAEHQPLQRHRH